MNQPSLLDRPAVKAEPIPVVTETSIAIPEHPSPALVENDMDAMTAFAQVGIGIDAAVAIATQLNHIVRKQELFTKIGNKDHLWVEAWCTCAGMCGLSPRTVWCKRITDDKGVVTGYEARVEVVRLSTNQIVGAAETECWMDEKKAGRLRWTEKHAAKSMAQTRGTSKAIAQILRWIPVMAGYSGTPAEEADNENGMPPVRDNPEHDSSAPQTAGRDDRVSRDDIERLIERWRKVTGKKGTASEWSGFVLAATGREFEVHKPFSWTPADIQAVDKFLRENHYG